MTTKVRMRPAWEKREKTTSEKPRPKKRTSGIIPWTVRKMPPASLGTKWDMFSSKTGQTVKYLKVVSPNFATCGMTV
jgi:hypothetical protein